MFEDYADKLLLEKELEQLSNAGTDDGDDGAAVAATTREQSTSTNTRPHLPKQNELEELVKFMQAEESVGAEAYAARFKALEQAYRADASSDENDPDLSELWVGAAASLCGLTDVEAKAMWQTVTAASGELDELLEDLSWARYLHAQTLTATKTVIGRGRNRKIIYTFGDVVHMESFRADKEERNSHRQVLAEHVKPVALIVKHDTGEPGVRIWFKSRFSEGHADVPKSAAEDRNEAREVVKDLLKQGVNIHSGKGVELVDAVCTWADVHKYDAELITVASKPGWYENSSKYVIGHEVIGDTQWEADVSSPALRYRKSIKGDLATSSAGFIELATTSVLRLVLGLSLAGALVTPLDHENFFIHLQGFSSSGKTSSALLAAAVWGAPHGDRDVGIIHRWNITPTAAELSAEGLCDAIFILDEIKEMDPNKVQQLIHRLADGQGRLKAMGYGSKVRPPARFRLVGLSTGEVTSSDYIGDRAQGGHAVRMMDIALEKGDATESAAHAESIHEFTRNNYGAVGRAWVEHLVDGGKGLFDKLAQRHSQICDEYRATIENDGELTRIIGHLALIWVALEEADEAGILPNDWAREVFEWTLDRIKSTRGEHVSPVMRAYSDYRQLYYAAPAHFPIPDQYEHAKCEVFGVSDVAAPPKGMEGRQQYFKKTGDIHVLEEMLKSSGIPQNRGLTPRQFKNELEKLGLATIERDENGNTRRRTIGGQTQRWITIHLDVHPADDPNATESVGQNSDIAPQHDPDADCHRNSDDSQEQSDVAP